jgi:hypothetical protein
MSDYRDPNDPYNRNIGYEPTSASTKTGWVWLAAAIFFVIVLAVAFGVGHEPNRVASNDRTAPSAMSPLTPPAARSPATPTPTPSLIPPQAPSPTPTPNQ